MVLTDNAQKMTETMRKSHDHPMTSNASIWDRLRARISMQEANGGSSASAALSEKKGVTEAECAGRANATTLHSQATTQASPTPDGHCSPSLTSVSSVTVETNFSGTELTVKVGQAHHRTVAKDGINSAPSHANIPAATWGGFMCQENGFMMMQNNPAAASFGALAHLCPHGPPTSVDYADPECRVAQRQYKMAASPWDLQNGRADHGNRLMRTTTASNDVGPGWTDWRPTPATSKSMQTDIRLGKSPWDTMVNATGHPTGPMYSADYMCPAPNMVGLHNGSSARFICPRGNSEIPLSRVPMDELQRHVARQITHPGGSSNYRRANFMSIPAAARPGPDSRITNIGGLHNGSNPAFILPQVNSGISSSRVATDLSMTGSPACHSTRTLPRGTGTNSMGYFMNSPTTQPPRRMNRPVGVIRGHATYPKEVACKRPATGASEKSAKQPYQGRRSADILPDYQTAVHSRYTLNDALPGEIARPASWGSTGSTASTDRRTSSRGAVGIPALNHNWHGSAKNASSDNLTSGEGLSGMPARPTDLSQATGPALNPTWHGAAKRVRSMNMHPVVSHAQNKTKSQYPSKNLDSNCRPSTKALHEEIPTTVHTPASKLRPFTPLWYNLTKQVAKAVSTTDSRTRQLPSDALTNTTSRSVDAAHNRAKQAMRSLIGQSAEVCICEICEAKFQTKSGLVAHMQVHLHGNMVAGHYSTPACATTENTEKSLPKIVSIQGNVDDGLSSAKTPPALDNIGAVGQNGNTDQSTMAGITCDSSSSPVDGTTMVDLHSRAKTHTRLDTMGPAAQNSDAVQSTMTVNQHGSRLPDGAATIEFSSMSNTSSRNEHMAARTTHTGFETMGPAAQNSATIRITVASTAHGSGPIASSNGVAQTWLHIRSGHSHKGSVGFVRPSGLATQAWMTRQRQNGPPTHSEPKERPTFGGPAEADFISPSSKAKVDYYRSLSKYEQVCQLLDNVKQLSGNTGNSTVRSRLTNSRKTLGHGLAKKTTENTYNERGSATKSTSPFESEKQKPGDTGTSIECSPFVKQTKSSAHDFAKQTQVNTKTSACDDDSSGGGTSTDCNPLLNSASTSADDFVKGPAGNASCSYSPFVKLVRISVHDFMKQIPGSTDTSTKCSPSVKSAQKTSPNGLSKPDDAGMHTVSSPSIPFTKTSAHHFGKQTTGNIATHTTRSPFIESRPSSSHDLAKQRTANSTAAECSLFVKSAKILARDFAKQTATDIDTYTDCSPFINSTETSSSHSVRHRPANTGTSTECSPFINSAFPDAGNTGTPTECRTYTRSTKTHDYAHGTSTTCGPIIDLTETSAHDFAKQTLGNTAISTECSPFVRSTYTSGYDVSSGNTSASAEYSPFVRSTTSSNHFANKTPADAGTRTARNPIKNSTNISGLHFTKQKPGITNTECRTFAESARTYTHDFVGKTQRNAGTSRKCKTLTKSARIPAHEVTKFIERAFLAETAAQDSPVQAVETTPPLDVSPEPAATENLLNDHQNSVPELYNVCRLWEDFPSPDTCNEGGVPKKRDEPLTCVSLENTSNVRVRGKILPKEASPTQGVATAPLDFSQPATQNLSNRHQKSVSKLHNIRRWLKDFPSPDTRDDGGIPNKHDKPQCKKISLKKASPIQGETASLDFPPKNALPHCTSQIVDTVGATTPNLAATADEKAMLEPPSVCQLFEDPPNPDSCRDMVRDITRKRSRSPFTRLDKNPSERTQGDTLVDKKTSQESANSHEQYPDTNRITDMEGLETCGNALSADGLETFGGLVEENTSMTTLHDVQLENIQSSDEKDAKRQRLNSESEEQHSDHSKSTDDDYLNLVIDDLGAFVKETAPGEGATVQDAENDKNPPIEHEPVDTDANNVPSSETPQPSMASNTDFQTGDGGFVHPGEHRPEIPWVTEVVEIDHADELGDGVEWGCDTAGDNIHTPCPICGLPFQFGIELAEHVAWHQKCLAKFKKREKREKRLKRPKAKRFTKRRKKFANKDTKDVCNGTILGDATGAFTVESGKRHGEVMELRICLEACMKDGQINYGISEILGDEFTDWKNLTGEITTVDKNTPNASISDETPSNTNGKPSSVKDGRGSEAFTIESDSESDYEYLSSDSCAGENFPQWVIGKSHGLKKRFAKVQNPETSVTSTPCNSNDVTS